MTTFNKGDRVTVVEHDDAARRPRPGGREFPAFVRAVRGRYVEVVYDDPTLTRTGADVFWRESRWRAWDREFRWRLRGAGGRPDRP